ncbi:MAG: dnaK 4 [Planctomycetaceae bacterium]|nr:dnaK 4 [Planctomycetaceae bacterium]
MQATQAVGIDLGTTYSCIAALNEHGEPISVPNPEGELSTPSVVFFDQGEEVVGVEALRNAVARPERVVQNAKRYMGDPKKKWTIGNKSYSPTDISGIILRQLISNAEKQFGKITQAVITVPAQFSDAQRAATADAGRKAGLKQIDIINEPVAAALCYVLGTEGIWFTELANEQTILVYDLGGGTFDLSLVRYKQDEVRVVASTGDLHLGGIDFNQTLLDDTAERFTKDFASDPRDNPESLQYLSWEVEQTKRSLTVRPRATINVQHAGHRKSYQVEQAKFNELTAPLVQRTEDITKQLLKENKLGWARVDVVLMTGGSSRMPMIQGMLKRLSGRTINTSLSPDQSIAHGATYYAGMLLSKSEFVKSILSVEVAAKLKKVQQKSVTARGLGILIRDVKTNSRVPHYLIQPNTPLPASATQTFGTVIENQKRVHLHIVESGARPELPYVQLGNCVIEDLPKNLKRDSEIAVTIRYDESARVHVSAKDVTSGKEATTELIRTENLRPQEIANDDDDDDLRIELGNEQVHNAAEQTMIQKSRPLINSKPSIKPVESPQRPVPRPGSSSKSPSRELDLDNLDIPVALCNKCGEVLNARGICPDCGPSAPAKRPASQPAPVASKPVAKPAAPPSRPASVPPSRPVASSGKPGAPKPMDDDDIIDLFNESPTESFEVRKPAAKPIPKPAPKPAPRPVPPPTSGSRPTVKPPPPPQPRKRPEQDS